MRKFASIPPKVWQADLKAVRGDIEAIAVHYHLTTSGHANMLGLYYVPVPYIAHEMGCPIEGASKGLNSLIRAGICAYDFALDLVWVCEMASDQVAPQLSPKDKRVKGIAEQLAMIPICPTSLGFYGRYRIPFHLHEELCLEEFELAYSDLQEAPSKPLRSKEKEKEKEKDLEEGKGPSGLGGQETSNVESTRGPFLTPYPKPASPADGKRFLVGLGVPEREAGKYLDTLMAGHLTPIDIEEWIAQPERGAA
ncbi:hypothetical protein [Rhizobium hidalgonense]|uniref:Replication protein n=1 Tax=Rhizobium hidalgonense TaxID=1538159 RepID=A0ABX4JWG3_9HYPH|nr:hypothetical protein [Rhizobium hidalgonense]PDT24452.1 hypothetical protein CO674_07145 [Rhizobium hidalgonense]PON04843.1 hypothetical protein ATY29_25635 [Rhizobium hidalgonense]